MPRAKRSIAVEKYDNPKYDPATMQPELRFEYRVKSAQNTLVPSVGEFLTFFKLNQLIVDGITVHVTECKKGKK